MPLPKFDTHVHVYSRDLFAFPRQPSSAPPPPEPAEAEDLLRLMDAKAVKCAVLVQPSYYGEDPSYALDCVRRYADRLCAVLIAEYWREEGVERARSDLSHPQVRGLRFNAAPRREKGSDWIDSPLVHQIAEVLAALGKVAVVQAEVHQLQRLHQLAKGHPRVPFVIDHMGLPLPGETSVDEYRRTWERLAACENVYGKISGVDMTGEPFPAASLKPYARAMAELLGASRLLWGTNYPYVLRSASYEQAGEEWITELLDFDDADLKQLFWGTAERLWGG